MNRHQRRAKLGQTSRAGPVELLQAGLDHHRFQRLKEAKACYRRLLAVQPEHPDALHLLGLIAQQEGREDQAVKFIRRAIQQNSTNARYFLDLGFALIRQRKLDEAAVACRQAIAIEPDLALAHSNLGIVLKDLGKPDEAVAACRQAVVVAPGLAVAHHNLGVVLLDQGKRDDAIDAYRRALAIEPELVEAYCNLAVALKEQGNFAEAIDCCRRAIAIKPNWAEAYSNLGMALFDDGKPEEAMAAYRSAIEISPDYPDAAYNLGVAFLKQGRLAEAVSELRRAIFLDPEFAAAHDSLGLALLQLGELAESRSCLECAVRLAPNNPRYRMHLGEFTDHDAKQQLAALENLVGSAVRLSENDQIDLHFAMGKTLDDLGQHKQAFQHWSIGNARKRQTIAYDEAEALGEMVRIPDAMTPALERWRDAGNPSSVPIFVLGMMRSGSTLVEQILASHPEVAGGGELKFLPTAVTELQSGFGAARYPEFIESLTGADYDNLGARYLADIEPLSRNAIHVTDKMPMNFLYTGLIHLALPNAPIIHTVRDPVDTCLSCFSKLFGDPQPHTYDLAELGRYYRHYRNLMAYWHRALPPGRILDVRYEDVVEDLEGQARRIIAHCGLEWDPRCLAFHQTKRPILTSSFAQVRRPIYNSAVGRRQAYESYLEPLLAELALGEGPAADRS